MLKLDRPGIFKATVLHWSFKAFPGKMSRAVNIGFKITAQLGDGNVWQDWSGYEDHTVYGDFFIVGKDGRVLVEQLERLSESLKWNGDVRDIPNGLPPEIEVQIKVEEEIYENKPRYKAMWINPKEYTGGRHNQTDIEEVSNFHNQYGSQIRAAIGAKAFERDKTLPKSRSSKPPKKAPPTICPVTPEEVGGPFGPPSSDSTPFDAAVEPPEGNQDDGNPFADVPDEAGDAASAPPMRLP